MINCVTQKQAIEMRCCGPEHCGHLSEDKKRFCIGKYCMAWRWQTAIFNLETKQWLQPGERLDKFETRCTDVGYCGLAGVPAP